MKTAGPHCTFTVAGETRCYQGEGGGVIVFQPGTVRVHANKAAAIAANPTTKKAGLTIPRGKRQPPEFENHFAMACAARGAFYDANMHQLPRDPSPEMLQTLGSVPVAHYAWYLIHAMANGDWQTLQKFTDATRHAAEIVQGAGIYEEVIQSLETAAREANMPPTKKAVFDEWKRGKSKNQIGGKEDLRDELGKLGFGWLAPGVRGPAVIQKKAGRDLRE